jgi:hypothetical protein
MTFLPPGLEAASVAVRKPPIDPVCGIFLRGLEFLLIGPI